MKPVLAWLIALTLVILLSAPTQAATATEVLTINVDLTIPSGRTLVGTFVVHRQASGSKESWTFNGMLDGRHLVANGTANEVWDAHGLGTIELTALNTPGLTLASLPIRTATINVGNGGVVTLVGVPLAISGPINPPGTGDATLLVTNAGQGVQTISRLPNTSGSMPLSIEIIAGMLVALGAVLLLAGARWLLLEDSRLRYTTLPLALNRSRTARRSSK